MQKTAPSLGRILTMVLFALSCFGLLTFLWLTFGGPTPLKEAARARRLHSAQGLSRRPATGGISHHGAWPGFLELAYRIAE